MLFINTRPTDRAQALTKCLMRAQYDVFELPLLTLKARPLDEPLHQLYQELMHAQVIVVVSPTAVEIGMHYLQQLNIPLSALSHVQWVAVGQKTAEILAKYGIESIIPEIETSEGMLELPVFHSTMSLKAVAFWRGEGGRQFMMQKLESQGTQVLNFLLYVRYCPDEAVHQIQVLNRVLEKYPKLCWVLVSSEASWLNWLNLCKTNSNIWNKCHYLVLGERLYQRLNNDKTHLRADFSVRQLNDLSAETVLNVLNDLTRKL